MDSAGVEIVESPGKDTELMWALQREFELGGQESGPESFFSVGPLTVDVDAGGRIYVLNPQESHVAIFSPEGEYIRTVGAHGEGPGEISMAASLSVSTGGTVSIFDFGKGGLVQFGPDGDFIRNLPFRFFP
ncbi:6-bladed beta-propeller, partial [Gemmatimonadota bacterium]